VKGVSIVICCYNSAKRLPKTLEYLAKQEIDSTISWEILIVDNVCTDDTTTVANSEWAKWNRVDASFRVVSELKPGLSEARKKGVLESAYDYVIFCDDDNWLDKKYVELSYQIMSLDKSIGALGGHSEAMTNNFFPDWFEEYKNGYAVGKPAKQSRYTTRRKSVWGAGMVTRKALFLAAFKDNLPPLLSDRNGKILSSGGDTEFVMRLIFMGHQLYYDDRLFFIHYIPIDRLTISYREALFNGFKQSHVFLEPYSRQAEIAFLNRFEAITFFIKTLIKLFLTWVGLTKRYSLNEEILMFYHLTGIKLKKIDTISCKVRDLYLELKNMRSSNPK
jgi:glycosyltransferase involved in cell wall biosynthesis